MEEGFVTISKKRYDDLIENEKLIRALEAAGVDNWEGYEIAIDILDEWDD